MQQIRAQIDDDVYVVLKEACDTQSKRYGDIITPALRAYLMPTAPVVEESLVIGQLTRVLMILEEMAKHVGAWPGQDAAIPAETAPANSHSNGYYSASWLSDTDVETPETARDVTPKPSFFRRWW